MKITFHNNFRKQYKKAPNKIQTAIDDRLKLFQTNPIHPILRNHSLIGVYGYRSINVTGDWRAIYKELDPIHNEPHVRFMYLGTHSKLYK